MRGRRKKAKEEVIQVPFIPEFAVAAMHLLSRVAQEAPLNEGDRQVAAIIRDTISRAQVEWMRGP